MKIKKEVLALGVSMLAGIQFGCGQFAKDHSLDGYTTVSLGNRAFESLDLMQNFGEMKDPFQVTTAPSADLILFALNTNGVPFPRGSITYANATAANSSTNWIVPNGTYTFYAIGYNSASMGGGNPFCGQALGDDATAGHVIGLNGGSKTIDVTMATATCGSPPFMGNSTGSAQSFTAFGQIAFCNGPIPNDSSPGLTTLCSGLTGTPAASTGIGSARVSIQAASEFGGGAGAASPINGISSGCLTVTSGVANSGLPMPVATDPNSASSIRIKTVIQTFSDAACATALVNYPLDTPGLAGGATVYTPAAGGSGTATSGQWRVSSGSGRLWLRYP